ncbi:hypothetical protein HU200_053663 [Digitaria exilis]|uniref:Uncharacterized protein n=1 Tax=Digitaria exilis TaxID=1010633 RepID=A0A835ARM7_9POAL|nr:hypothetical protein HU200_053663 [Digitaria exilis]
MFFTDMVLVEVRCSHLSGTYKGCCTSIAKCQNVCAFKSYDYYDGKDQGFLPARCCCITDRLDCRQGVRPRI